MKMKIQNRIWISSIYLRPVEVDGENDTAFVMSTSGSTGPSKGMELKQFMLISFQATSVTASLHI